MIPGLILGISRDTPEVPRQPSTKVVLSEILPSCLSLLFAATGSAATPRRLAHAGELRVVRGPELAGAAPSDSAFPGASSGLASSQHEVPVSGGGTAHEVALVCRGEESGLRDGEKVVEAWRLKWNFHGNKMMVLGDAVWWR